MNKNKGITLLALVITMIVLLMLAGVTLEIVIGSNGIIEKAEKTISENDKKNAKEDIELVISEFAKEYYLKDTKENLFDYLAKKLPPSKDYETLNKAKLSVDANGDVTYSKDNNTYMFSVDKNGKVQPRISGLYAKNGTMSKTWDELIEEGIITVTDGILTKVEGKENELQGKIVVDETVTTIGGSAFNNCTKLTEVNLPCSVTRICGSAFQNCTSLTTVNIPKEITALETGTFASCEKLEKIYIPKGISTIGMCNFYGCKNLTIYAMDFYSNNIPDGWVSDWNSNYPVIWADSYEVPDSYTYSFDASYTSEDDVMAYIYPKEGTNGNEILFTGKGCAANISNFPITDKNIVSAKIASGITSFAWLLGGCKDLKEVILPGTLTGIGPYSFNGCTNLMNITIPSSVNNMSYCIFDGWTAEQTIHIKGKKENSSNWDKNSCPVEGWRGNATLCWDCPH